MIGGVDILVLATAGLIAAPYAFAYDMPVTALALLLACQQRPELDNHAAWRWGVFLLWVAPIAMFIVGVLPWRGAPWYGAGATMLIGALALILLALRQGSLTSGPRVQDVAEVGAQPPTPARAPAATFSRA